MANIELSTIKNMPKLPHQGGGGGGGDRFKPKEKPKNAKRTLLRVIKIYINWKWSLALCLILTVFSVMVTLATPYYMGIAIGSMNINTGTVDKPLLYISLVSLICCYIAAWVITTINAFITTTVSQRLVKHIRNSFFVKLQSLPLEFYDTRANGDTMSRLTNDIDSISSTVAQSTAQLISGLLSICGSFVMMLILSPVLTMATMITIPLIYLLTRMISGKSRHYFSRQAYLLGSVNAIIEENIVGMKMVKAFNRQDTVLKNFNQVNEQLKQNSSKANMWSGFMMPLMNVINNISFALIATLGGFLSITGGLNVSVVVSFVSYSKQFAQPLNNIASMFTTIQSALAGAERVFEILDQNEEIPDKSDCLEVSHINGDVEFKSVSFGYTPETTVLKNISFRVSKGETIALVGETGAGKTTIVNLLTRFYEISDGEILIDNTNISKIKRKSLRSFFSVVLQDTCLFSGTIMDNIRYSNPLATDIQVTNAAKLAFADNFIRRLPDGYKTKVSASADNLSQGQRQLIAIARAILCEAKILILDEATSSVDTKTEKEIQKALLTLMKDKTSFLIAHRLSTIKDANKIMVVGNKNILESGTHIELMKNKSHYYNMVMSQIGKEI